MARFFFCRHAPRIGDSYVVVDQALTYLRPATRGDGFALARMRSASLLELGTLQPSGDVRFEREAAHAFEDLLASGRLDAWLLVACGRIAGSASVLFWQRLPYPETSLHAELAGVYVAPGLRKRGFARELCREVIDVARARGVRHIVVHPSSGARSLYTSLGFGEGNEMRL
jgi:GNAT superfamily N-acetyltransferase